MFDIFFGNHMSLNTNMSTWLQIIMCMIITATTLLTVYSLRGSLKRLQAKILPYKDQYDTEWLNSHTLYFRGLLVNDGHGKL
mmetsp:Transcript_19515/g.17283  ORF Transcript_19515/g.17283 Transcript_19515/m.17283 type:complete len:82 (+) Transcript_19515:417-662(+)